MANFFNTIFPKRVGPEIQRFLIECLQLMPTDTYNVYVQQLREGLLLYESETELHHPKFENYISFTYNTEISSRFQKENDRFWRLRNILIRDCSGTLKTKASIFFSHGLVCGYSFAMKRNFDRDHFSVDVSNAQKEFLDSPDPVVKALIPQLDQDKVNWSDVYEVEIDGVRYFHLRDLEDGDFIGIDEDGLFYEFRHDPYQIVGVDKVTALSSRS